MSTHRYSPEEVRDALAATERGTYTPHSQIVLAAEVLAIRAALLESLIDLTAPVVPTEET